MNNPAIWIALATASRNSGVDRTLSPTEEKICFVFIVFIGLILVYTVWKILKK